MANASSSLLTPPSCSSASPSSSAASSSSSPSSAEGSCELKLSGLVHHACFCPSKALGRDDTSCAAPPEAMTSSPVIYWSPTRCAPAIAVNDLARQLTTRLNATMPPFIGVPPTLATASGTHPVSPAEAQQRMKTRPCPSNVWWRATTNNALFFPSTPSTERATSRSVAWMRSCNCFIAICPRSDKRLLMPVKSTVWSGRDPSPNFLIAACDRRAPTKKEARKRSSATKFESPEVPLRVRASTKDFAMLVCTLSARSLTSSPYTPNLRAQQPWNFAASSCRTSTT
mmetsp:Transcript_48668/g.120681  ORF Transcript_48668/g.120681 Transcript_48668/m.120681 type:complete len:285 (-) Transcript_48668:1581-2435(-)